MTNRLTIATGLALVAGSAASALTFSNGPLSTGAINQQGAAAPAGTTWSQVQVGNDSAGALMDSAELGGCRLTDDFTVGPGGWTISSFRFFGYQTGAATTASTINALNFRIWSGRPEDAGSVVVFGDTTTNRLTGQSFANMYRIFAAPTAADTTRSIRNLDANLGAGVTLAAGTYWVDWQTAGTVASGPWAPMVTIPGVVTQASWNARQFANAAWQNVNGNTTGINPSDVAFEFTYALVPTPGAAALLGMAGLAGIRRRR